MSALVSVITPTKNRVDELVKSIYSVANQDYHGTIEHIVVGDNHPCLENLSTDLRKINLNLSICNLSNSYTSSSYNGFIPVYPPSRISYCRNYGITLAHGEYIAHLDDDNEYEHDHISSLVKILEDDTTTDVAFSGRRLIWPDGSPYLEQRYPWVLNNRPLAKYLYEELVRKGIFIRGSNIVHDMVIAADGEAVLTVDTSELLIRRRSHKEFLFTINYSPRAMMQHHTEDYDLVKRLYEAGVQMKYTGKATLRYRLGGYSNAGK